MKRNEYIDPHNLEFHYKREDRIRTLDPSVRDRDKKTGFFKKNKQMTFILLDIVLIVLIFLIMQPLISSQKTAKNIYGCNFRLENLVYDDKILLSLKIEQKATDDQLPVSIDIEIYENKNETAVKTIHEDLDFSEKKTFYIRAEIAIAPDLKNIHTDIRFGKKHFRLHNTIKGL